MVERVSRPVSDELAATSVHPLYRRGWNQGQLDSERLKELPPKSHPEHHKAPRSGLNECIGLKSAIQNERAGSATTCRFPGAYLRTQCFWLLP
jgi:hypothetical protein